MVLSHVGMKGKPSCCDGSRRDRASGLGIGRDTCHGIDVGRFQFILGYFKQFWYFVRFCLFRSFLSGGDVGLFVVGGQVLFI